MTMRQRDDIQPDDPVMAYTAHRIGSDPASALSHVPLEEPLSIEVNRRQVAVLMRLPGHERELAVGFCISEGLITDFQRIEIVQHCGAGSPEPGTSEGDEEGCEGAQI